MKHPFFLLLLLLAVLLSACSGGNPEQYTSEDGYFVDTVSDTITGPDGIVYSYKIGSSTITITYPNGATYYQTQHDQFGTAGWSDDYRPQQYAAGDKLVEVLSQRIPKKKEFRPGSILAGILLIGLGIWHAAAPESAWAFGWKWQIKFAEPTEAALILTRIEGIAAILIGIVMFFR